jgi:hypothetical protein
MPPSECLVTLHRDSFALSARHTGQHTTIAFADTLTNNTEHTMTRPVIRLPNLASYNAASTAIVGTLLTRG